MKAFLTVLLLVTSNIFMTFAWYGHLKLQEMKISTGWPVFLVILFSWGASLLRILRTGAGKPHRLLRQRRSVQHHAAESDSGSCFPDGLHDHRDVPFQGPAAPVEPPGSVRLPDIGCIFRLSEVNFQKNQKKYLDCKEI